MFYTEFDDIIPDEYKGVDLLPDELRAEIEGTNDWTYNDINNGVYKSGFASYVRSPVAPSLLVVARASAVSSP